MTDLRDRLTTSFEGTYTLENELGGGGMARVYVANEIALSRKVVIKLLRPELAEALSSERFVREIRLAARLQQANIVPVLQAGEIAGLPYYTMPFVAGESLRVRLQQGPVPAGDALAILRDVAKALAFAHDQGVVHRDIKPENILISGGTAVVTDFGIAKAISASRNDEHTSVSLTLTGTSIGTPAYMSPEQAAGDASTDARTDLYAWGVVAYELLTGAHPFAAHRSASDVVRAHMVEPPPPLTAPRIPEAIRGLVMRCLAKSPDDRPRNAAELLTTLDGAPITTNSGTSSERRPFGVVNAMAIYVSILVAVLAVAKVSITAIGLPTWVLGGSAGIMVLGLPVVLLTALVERQRRAMPAAFTSNAITRLATWRTTRRGGVAVFTLFVLMIAGYMGMRQFGVGPFASVIGTKKLAAQDRVLIADFRGPASDTSLGAVFGEGMRAALAESKVIRIIERDQASDALVRMRTPGVPIVGPVAGEVAERSGAKAVLDGDVKTIGKSYALTARLLLPRGGDPLITLQETARDDADFTAAIGRLAKRLRAKIGESLRSVNATPELFEVTTASLPALRKYTEAERAIFGRGEYDRGLQLLREAVSLDTGFAMAYMDIGSVYSRYAPGQRQLAAENFQKAFDARQRATAHDRAQIEISYWGVGPTPDAEQERVAMAKLAEIDSVRHATRLAAASIDVRDWTRALSFGRIAMANDAAGAVTYSVMINAFGMLGQMDSVRYYVDRLRDRAPRGPTTQIMLVSLATHLGDDSTAMGAIRELQRMSSPITVEIGKRNEAMISLRQGKLRAARRALEAQLESERLRGATGTQRARLASEALTQATLFGDSARAMALLDSSLKIDPWENSAPRDRDYFYYAMAAAASNRLDLVRAVADRLRRDDPKQLLPFGGFVLPLLDGLALRGEGKYAEAIASFRQSDVMGISLFPTAFIAQTFDGAGQKDSALVYYEKVVNTTMMGLWTVADSRYGQQARRRLGELYEERGQFDKAYDAYSSFVRIWRDADPELQPAVATVRARMKSLEARRAR